MDAIKFQNVILPDAAVTLTLDYRVDKQQLNFSYVSALSAETTRAHSSGRMRFEAA